MRFTDVERLRETREMVAALKKRFGLAPYQISELSLPVGEAIRLASELDDWVEDAIFIAESLAPLRQ